MDNLGQTENGFEPSGTGRSSGENNADLDPAEYDGSVQRLGIGGQNKKNVPTTEAYPTTTRTGQFTLPNGVRPFCRCVMCQAIREQERSALARK